MKIGREGSKQKLSLSHCELWYFIPNRLSSPFQSMARISSLLSACGCFISRTVFATNSQPPQKHMRWRPNWQTVGDVHAATAGSTGRLVAVASPAACHAETLQPRPAVC
jgi:hypothetical protein